MYCTHGADARLLNLLQADLIGLKTWQDDEQGGRVGIAHHRIGHRFSVGDAHPTLLE